MTENEQVLYKEFMAFSKVLQRYMNEKTAAEIFDPAIVYGALASVVATSKEQGGELWKFAATDEGMEVLAGMYVEAAEPHVKELLRQATTEARKRLKEISGLHPSASASSLSPEPSLG